MSLTVFARLRKRSFTQGKKHLCVAKNDHGVFGQPPIDTSER